MGGETTTQVAKGMEAVISALTNSTTGLTASTMFGVVADLVPFIVMIVPVALGVYFLRKLIKGAGKAKVRILKIDKEKNISRLEIIIHEGKNREVRKTCESVGKKVIALHRAKIANIDVKNLKIGQWRFLTKEEVKTIVNQ